MYISHVPAKLFTITFFFFFLSIFLLNISVVIHRISIIGGKKQANDRFIEKPESKMAPRSYQSALAASSGFAPPPASLDLRREELPVLTV